MATRPVEPPGAAASGHGAPPPSSVHVLRPRDLVSFRVHWSGMSLDRPAIAADATPRDARRAFPQLVAGAAGGRLTVDFVAQHVAEAFSPNDGPTPGVPSVAARAANPSRLVFAVPPATTIDYSTDGLLAAMATLTLDVAPLATPAPITLDWLGTVSVLDQVLGTATTLGVSSIAIDAGAAARTVTDGHTALVAANRLIRAGALTATRQRLIADPFVFEVIGEPRAPHASETAIEAPFRLILSPSSSAAWAHAIRPVVAQGAPGRIELWHSRLAVQAESGPDEVDTSQRIVRAIWNRDRAMTTPVDPFPMLPAHDDRNHIVAQTVGSPDIGTAVPEPVRVRRLALSALGAWLDLHVTFPSAQQYPADFHPLTSWDQVSPMGRDQFVRIVKPGYLYPTGHAAYVVQIVYRKVAGSPPQAALFERVYIVLGDADRAFSRRDLPFVAATIGPLRTPDLNAPSDFSQPFWPTPSGTATPLDWKLAARDHDGAVSHFATPLLYVPTGTPASAVDAALKLVPTALTVDTHGQTVAFAPALAPDQVTPGATGGSASAELRRFTWAGATTPFDAQPFMVTADVAIPAIQRLTPGAGGATVTYDSVYFADGFGPANVGNVYLALTTPTTLSFGSSAHSGGFVRPDVHVAALARSTGLVSDPAAAAAGTFDPKTLFGGGLPKLFGLFDLADLIPGGPLALAPKFVTEQLDRVSALLHDLDTLAATATAASLAPAAKFATQATAVATAISTLLTTPGPASDASLAAVKAQFSDLATTLATLETAAAAAIVPPFTRARLDRLIASVKIALDASKLVGLIAAVGQFVQGLAAGGGDFRAHLDWETPLTNLDPITFKDPLRLSVEVRAAAGHPGVDIAAELTNFGLVLLDPAPLMEVTFTRLAFRAGTARKPEVDVVFGGMQFLGILSFIDVLRSIIPMDGFSDPPFLDVTPDGVTAGFTLAIPNVAVGLFSLTNISLGADARIPFLGASVSVGFNFCTRERPFTLAVFPLGGGGFVGLRLDPTGMILLEMALEFGACVALDFGVASGSVSAMGGVYIRLEGPAGSLTGYFRIRGEVDVLSLISASLELYLALTYAFDTGKMVGEATMTIHVSVLFFSTSVSVHAQRQFAGSNGDPTARDMLFAPHVTTSPTWDHYCAAFADEAGA